jgi:hypothetical protein
LSQEIPAARPPALPWHRTRHLAVVIRITAATFVGTTECGLIHEYELAASVSESSFRMLRPELALLIASHQEERAVLEDHASGC